MSTVLCDGFHVVFYEIDVGHASKKEGWRQEGLKGCETRVRNALTHARDAIVCGLRLT